MSGKKWALLVAGSKGWDYYRHQANVCCAYQIIKKHGIPDKQIVVMMYDDIAQNPKNPYPGNITSAVTELGDVYPGVPKDYTGKDVNPKNFLTALQGKPSSEKVIDSGSNDEIFIYMSTTGGDGKFDFPEQSLLAADLIGAVNSMHNEKKFSKMAIYMDSDYSATMFKDLSQYNNVYAVSSCDQTSKNIPSDKDSSRGISLSDEFSSALLKFINTADYNSATLKNLFDNLSKSVTSNASQFGDMEIRDCQLSVFLEQKAEPSKKASV
ncbi:legumain-like [Megalobrama amblycephala]|uniref:legumain-like n=1 Tax=Megalobrama amblycephala TaxID=75352 RepID=UPI00201482CB|nr:legumain-like [Megalobrama amblycephala]XP_048027507.1 legumain-like [Megalobrama amblycephala]XP_048027508.1 legumain-like [Megalobrama amblycephala]